MNLYVRYFGHETVVKTADEALDFLATIPEIRLEGNARNRINTFIKSSNLYPFRLKVTFSNYVLFLKTEADTLDAFKEEEAMRRNQKNDEASSLSERKKSIIDALNTENIGWWLTSLKFKRVITIPESGKCQYVDTTITVKQIANSAMDAYNRLIDHLKKRSDVDQRSQFPSAKSASFEYKFLGNEDPVSTNDSNTAKEPQVEAADNENQESETADNAAYETYDAENYTSEKDTPENGYYDNDNQENNAEWENTSEENTSEENTSEDNTSEDNASEDNASEENASEDNAQSDENKQDENNF